MRHVFRRNSIHLIFILFGILLYLGCQDQPKNSAPKAVKVNSDQFLSNIRSAEKKWLSEYGFFKTPIAQLDPLEGVYPYDLNNALFTDYAHKKRFIFLPKGKKMMYQKEGVMNFEEGSIIIKNFYYPKNFNAPDENIRNIETRLLIKEAEGWKPLNYIWNEDQTDAELNYIGGTVNVSWTDTSNTVNTIDYGIPNLNECKNCHINGKDITPIGPTAAQLNKKYSSLNSDNNQLSTFQEWGIIDLPDEHSALPKLPVWNDPNTGSITERAQAYLYANCAHCHRIEGSAKNSGLYLTYAEKDSRRRGIFKPPVAAGKGSGDLEYDIVPGRPDLSILFYRMKSNEPAVKMPEVGRSLAHREGLDLIESYIKALPNP